MGGSLFLMHFQKPTVRFQSFVCRAAGGGAARRLFRGCFPDCFYCCRYTAGFGSGFLFVSGWGLSLPFPRWGVAWRLGGAVPGLGGLSAIGGVWAVTAASAGFGWYSLARSALAL